jgi:hypothetical protein
MRLGWALATTLGCLLFFALAGVPGAETLPNSGVAPGALEPPPVDPAIEAEAEAHMKERHTRGVGAVWQDGAELELYPALQGGWVGWCLAVHGSAHDSASCPVAPRQTEIAYERWESGTGGTQGYVLAAAGLDGVAVNQGAIVPLTPVRQRPSPGVGLTNSSRLCKGSRVALGVVSPSPLRSRSPTACNALAGAAVLAVRSLLALPS